MIMFFPDFPSKRYEFVFLDGTIVCLDDTQIQPVNGVLCVPPYNSPVVYFRELTLDGRCVRTIDFDILSKVHA